MNRVRSSLGGERQGAGLYCNNKPENARSDEPVPVTVRHGVTCVVCLLVRQEVEFFVTGVQNARSGKRKDGSS